MLSLNLRPIIFVLGVFVVLLGVGMAVPAAIDLISGRGNWQAFVVSLSATVSIGGMMILANRGPEDRLTLRQAFLMTSLAWVILPAFAAIPLVFSELQLSYTDAYFEAVSGLTTTGATVITGLDEAPRGILIWRAMLQWLGGIGIVVMAIAVLPMLQVGGMQLFRLESSDTSEKILPKATQVIGAIIALYFSLTTLCTLMLMVAGLAPFDALAHAMTTISTGGFSTHDASIGHFANAGVDLTVMLFMALGSLPFALYLQAIRGRPLQLWQDEQVRGFLLLVVCLITAIGLWLNLTRGFGLAEALRLGGFNILSVLTGTGYATADYSSWGGFALTLFFVTMLVGGCAGSTSCGIKIFRMQVLLRSIASWTKSMLQPSGVFVARFNRRPISGDVQSSVMTFLIFFMSALAALTFALSLTGLDWIVALSGAATALANVGPGLGDTIGPAGTFQSLPETAKWLLSFGMLLGRLELFTILVLMTPAFWRG